MNPFSKIVKAVKNLSTFDYLMIFLSIAVFIYVLIRILNISFVHDESFTFTNYVYNVSLKDIYTFKIPLLNNHMLNSFLMKLTGGLLGYSEFTLRLPNLISFILYLICGTNIFKRIKNKPISIFGFILFVTNPFILDLFGVARGYGLGCGLMVSGIYFSLKSHDDSTKNKKKFLLFSYTFASLSVISNFSFLNFYLGLLSIDIIFILVSLLKNKHLTLRTLIKQIYIQIIITLVTLLFIAYPIYKLKSTNNLGFGGTSGLREDTITSLINSLFYNNSINQQMLNLISWIVVIVIFTGLIFLLNRIYLFIKSKKVSVEFILISGLFIFTTFSIVAQNLLLKNVYPIERGAVFYFILFVIFVTFIGAEIFDTLKSKNIKTFYYFLNFLIILFFVLNLFTNLNITKTYVWPYDESTKKVMLLINEDLETNKQKVNLAVNWIFFPAANFYKTIYHLDNLNLSFIEGKVDIMPDYYYFSKYYKDMYTLQIPNINNLKTEKKFESDYSTLVKILR